MNLESLPNIAFTVISRTFLFVVLGTILAWIILGVTVSQISCGAEAAMGCLVITIVTLFYLIGMPFLFLWFGRAYGLQKALKSVYESARPELLDLATKQIFDHKPQVLQFGSIKNNQFFTKLPLFIRLMLKRLDFNFLIPAIKKNPEISEVEIHNLLSQELKQKIHLEASWRWFWILTSIMILISIGASWFF